MKILIIAALFALPARAREVQFERMVNPSLLKQELISSGFAIDYIQANIRIGGGVIVMPDSETKDPSAVIAAHIVPDTEGARTTARTQAIALAKKLKAGTASAAEKDALLLRLCFLLLSTDQ